MKQYVEYLRKSRLDKDYNEISVEETLKRHQKILEEFAKKNNYNISKVYKEVVSGESIAERPEIQKLLVDVSTGEIDGILVMDIDRLSRGSSIDTGYIQQVLRFNSCKIVTPAKTYDLSNETDEQFTDMSFMLSRYEYRSINKRLIRGREMSASEGRYMGSEAPYGYEIVKIKGDKGNTLKIVPSEAEIVRMIFDLYVNHGMGYRPIANRLNELNIPTRKGTEWSMGVISVILKNPVYCGKIRYGRKKLVKTLENGVVKKSRQYVKDYKVYPGLHEAIISDETYEKMWQIRQLNDRTPTKLDTSLKNVFAGLVYCKKCGKKMIRVHVGGFKTKKEVRIKCDNSNCDQVSSSFCSIENSILDELRTWLDRYKVKIESDRVISFSDKLQNSLDNTNEEIDKINSQLEKAYNFLEQGIYSVDVFQKRTLSLNQKLETLEQEKTSLIEKLKNCEKNDNIKATIIPKTEHLLSSYNQLDVEEKHRLFKEILARIEYDKDKQTKQIKIEIFPAI